jgi:hypothetical protein
LTTAAIRPVYAWVAFGLAATARAETPQVTIEGGPDATGQSYEWTVTNNHASGIVRLEFPHYRANLFFAPNGWKTECTNLEAIGVRDPTGVCTASIEDSMGGNAESRSATFRMQIGGRGAKRGPGAVVVRFADGVTQTIVGVPVPTAEQLGDRNVPLIGLGTVFIIFVVARAAKRRRARAAESG